jgi:hypothetical protein
MDLTVIALRVATGFDLTKFKDSDDFNYIISYADKYLKELGEGSSRVVFDLSPDKVLKITGYDDNEDAGPDPRGIAQNKEEVNIYTNPKTKPVITRVFDFDPEYRWLISEKAHELNWQEFEQRSDEINNIIQDLVNGLDVDIDSKDLQRPEQWGITKDGRLVIIDYGFTAESKALYSTPTSWS